MLKEDSRAKQSPMSRTEMLKVRQLSLPREICLQRARFLTQSYMETEGEPMVIRRAKALKHILCNLSVNIWPGELIVGSITSRERGAGVYPEGYLGQRVSGEIDFVGERETNPFSITPEEIRGLKQDIMPYWEDKYFEVYARELWSKEVDDLVYQYGIFILTEIAGIGHILLNHQRVLELGLEGIIKETDGCLSQLKGENSDKKDFYEAVKISCQAAIDFAARYAKKAEGLATKERGKKRKAELENIAQICRNVPAQPARTFREALQAIYFVHIIAQIEDYEPAISVGRIDQILYPFYKRDVKEGRLSSEEAQTLLECFYLKLNSVIPLFDAGAEFGFGGGTAWANLIVGGTDEKGKDITNDVSYLAIDAREHTCLAQPNFGVRLHRGTPAKFFDRVCQSAASGKGALALYNDEVIVPALHKRGIALGDARNYALIGCVEPGVPGRSFTSSDSGLLNLPLAVELALNQGRSRISEKQIGTKTKDPREFKTIREVVEAYREQVEYLAEKMVEGTNVLGQVHAEHEPAPFASSFTEDCLREGKDLTWGGARYNFTGFQGVGVATVGDCLAAIDKLVFTEKRITMAQLLDALEKDFEGSEPLREMLVNRAPKYGNDDDDADGFACEAAEIFCRAVERHRNYRGGKYQPGLYSVTSHTIFGAVVGALPNGRKAGEPVSPSVSPAQGMNISGPTATLKSAAKINYELVTNGAALNLKFNPTSFKGEKDMQVFHSLLRTFFDLGGMHLHCNIVDKQTLLAAKEHPEEYQDLIVRVAGYSARFIDLLPVIQDEIISRTEHQV